jgi:hypothetical protein
MYPIASIRPSLSSTPRELCDDATYTSHSRATTGLQARLGNPTSTCFHAKQAATSRRVSRADLPPSDLWHNRQTEAHLVLRPKPRNRRGDFEAQITKPQLSVLKLELRNRRFGFDAQPTNPRSSSTRARCRPHMASPDLPITQPPSTRPVLDHPQSSAPGLLLLS